MEYQRVDLANLAPAKNDTERFLLSLWHQKYKEISKRLANEFKTLSLSVAESFEFESTSKSLHRFGVPLFNLDGRGRVAVEVDPKHLVRLTDSFYQSDEPRKGASAKQLTTSDLRMQARLGTAICAAFSSKAILTETATSFAASELIESTCVDIIMASKSGDTRVRLRFFQDFLDANNQDNTAQSPDINHSIKANLSSIPVSVCIQVWEKKLTMRDVIDIAPGAEIPMFMSEMNTLRVDNTPLFEGQLNERANQLLFEISRPILKGNYPS